MKKNDLSLMLALVSGATLLGQTVTLLMVAFLTGVLLGPWLCSLLTD